MKCCYNENEIPISRQETEKIIAQNKLDDNENQLEYYKK